MTFLLAYAAILLFGLPVVFHRRLRLLPIVSLAGVAFCAGAIVLSTWATLLALLHVPWSATLLTAPLLGLSAIGSAAFARRRDPVTGARNEFTLAPLLILLVSATYLAVAVEGTTKSADFLFFWGVKAVRFAAAHGFEPEFLRWPYAIHTHTNYPPLWPVTLSFGTLWTNADAMWRFGPAAGVLWILAAGQAAYGLLATSMRGAFAAAVSIFWTVSMLAAIDASSSFGNAEAPLVAFTTLAIAATIAERNDASRIVLAIALAGLALTKLEGIIAAVLIVAGIVMRDLLRRDRRMLWLDLRATIAPAAVASLWWVYLAANALPLNDPTREPLLRISFDHIGTIVAEMLRRSEAGALWLPWIVSLAFLAYGARRVSLSLIPAFVLAAGMTLFFFVYYLHATGDPRLIIGWTWNRTSLPVLTALLLSAGMISSQKRGVLP